MVHTQWFDMLKQSLQEIKTKYPQDSPDEQEKWKNRLQQVKKSCDQLLESWACLEDQIAHLLQEHPELAHEGEEFSEEIYLDVQAVRQFRQGQGYYQLMMFEDAELLFHQVLELEPDFILGRLYMGLACFQQRQFEDAEQHFRLVTTTASEKSFTSFAYHLLGCIAVQRGQDEQAVQKFKQAISIMDENSDTWFNLGACYYRLQEYGEAIPHFYHALSLNEDDWEAMYFLSHCYRHYQEWSTVSFWRFASLKKQKHPHIIQSIAHDFEEQGQHEEAIKWYQRLFAEDRKSAAAFQGIAWNSWVVGEKQEARLMVKKGLTLHPQHPDLTMLFMWMLLQEGDFVTFQKMIKSVPDEILQKPIWHAIHSRFIHQSGDEKQALMMTDRLLEQDHTMIKGLGHYQKGRMFLEQKEVDSAIVHFQKASHFVQSWKEPVFFEGICHMLNGKQQEFQNCWQKIALLD